MATAGTSYQCLGQLKRSVKPFHISRFWLEQYLKYGGLPVHGGMASPPLALSKAMKTDFESAHGEQPARECEAARSDMALLVVHLDAAYNLARWLMRNETDAEDLVQEAYVRAFAHFEGFRGGDGRAWLLAIVRNSCYDRLRQKGVREQDTAFDEALHSTQRTLDPENSLLLAERAESVRESLAELPAEYREVLVLRELEQLSYREIATIAAIPLGTVMSRLSRARERLQQSLCHRQRNDKGLRISPV
jgi:RNA polymerase sigma-70 factor (ECF subfamily)